jgi:hypothetical protein
LILHGIDRVNYSSDSGAVIGLETSRTGIAETTCKTNEQQGQVVNEDTALHANDPKFN